MPARRDVRTCCECPNLFVTTSPTRFLCDVCDPAIAKRKATANAARHITKRKATNARPV